MFLSNTKKNRLITTVQKIIKQKYILKRLIKKLYNMISTEDITKHSY